MTDEPIGTRHCFTLILDRVSNYEVEPKMYMGHEIPGRVVWRYQFHEAETGRHFVYSGKYIFGIDVKRGIGEAFEFRATVKRHEREFNQIRLSKMALQKSSENLFE